MCTGRPMDSTFSSMSLSEPNFDLKDRQNYLKQAITFTCHILKARLMSTKPHDGTDECPATLKKNGTAILDGIGDGGRSD